MTVITVSGSSASREGITMNRLTITATRKPTNDQRSTVSDRRGSSQVPICAPTTAPAARISAGIQATEPWTAYEMTPTVAVGTIAASDVPAASRWSNPRISTSSGTITVPPPTPNRPDMRPASRPTPMQVRTNARVARARVAGSITGQSSRTRRWPSRRRPADHDVRVMVLVRAAARAVSFAIGVVRAACTSRVV